MVTPIELYNLASDGVERAIHHKARHIPFRHPQLFRPGTFCGHRLLLSFRKRVDRLILTAFTYKGNGAAEIERRRKNLETLRASPRRKRDAGMIHSIFTRDGHPGIYDPAMADALVAAEMPFGNTIPAGTYIDMAANLPLVDPTQVKSPVLMTRGEWDGNSTEKWPQPLRPGPFTRRAIKSRSGDFPTPSPPAEKASTRQDQAGQRPVPAIGLGTLDTAAGGWAFRSVFKRNDPYGDAEKQQEKCRYPIRIKRHDISPSRPVPGAKMA
jgi:hypothetical protein